MSRIRFAIPLAMALGIVSFLSCSDADDAIDEAQNVVEHAKCAKNQGDWDANLKKCVKCADGMSMDKAGDCVAPAANVVKNDDSTTTIYCPPKTTLKGSKCVADAIKTDTNAVAGNFYCDYGKADPKEEGAAGIDCFAIGYKEECDLTWGKLVNSCKAADRRTDTPTFCDFGPVDEWGGGCYRILNNCNDCDLEWGIIANKCGSQYKWSGGTLRPGEIAAGVTQCRPTDKPSSSSVNKSSGSSIKSSNSNTLGYCDWGQPNTSVIGSDGVLDAGCWPIEEGEGCPLSKVVSTCPKYTCPSGSVPTNFGIGESGCKINSTTKSSSSAKANSSSSAAPSTPTLFCDYGYISSTDAELQLSEGGGCFELESADECDLEWGKYVKSCKAADRRTDLEFCDYGVWNEWGGGCWRINSSEDRSNCSADVSKGYAQIVKKCTWLNP